ncbi:hypothetical protein VP01_4113g2, partial [Puccinia sorghi]
GGHRNNILKQSFTLTLEELLLIAPKFIQELQNFSRDKERVMERSQNLGRFNWSNFEKEISMNNMGISGHSPPVVGLAEGISFNIDTEDRKASNFFIVCGNVYILLGRPFLADHKVRLELSQARGEIMSYKLWMGDSSTTTASG